MAASKNNNASTPDPALPGSIAQTMRLVQRIAHNATWGERIAAHHQLPAAANFGPRLFRRFDAASTPGVWASSFAQRFAADELAPSTTDLILAPYAPAQRQVSAARQGALPWSGGDDFSVAPTWPTGPIARSLEPSTHHSLLNDLATSGWDVQSSAPVQRSAAPPSASDSNRLAPIRRSPESQPAAQPITEPVRRSPESPLTPSGQSQSTLHRQVDTPGASSSGEQGSTDEAVQTRPTKNEPPAIQTAATRPMAFFQDTSRNPLMRMGLSESTGGQDTAAPSDQLPTPSGELPVVRPARPADEPDLAALSPTSAKIDRHAEPTVVPGQPSAAASDSSITSNNTADQANVTSRSTDGSGDIQHTASDPTDDTQPQAPVNRSGDLPHSAVSDAPVQRDTSQDVANSSSATSSPTPTATENASTPSIAIDRVASEPTAVSTAHTTRHQAGDPPTSSVSERVEPAADSASDTPTIARMPLDVTTGPSVQSSRDTSFAAPATEAADSGATDNGAAQPKDVTGQHAPVINRQVMPSAGTKAFDTVLPWATKLLQRYSTGDGPGTSGPMPLLRTHRATSAMTVMRSPEQLSSTRLLPATPSGIVASATSSAMPGATSTSSAASMPLVRRSAVVPVLLQASLQREPAVSTIAGGSVSSAEPTPSTAAPASLDWSALPLLQRLSVEHGLPATPPAPSTTGSGGASVAARLVQRLALDDPQAASAPMPLLRTQVPALLSTVMRAIDQPAHGGGSSTIPAHAPISIETGVASASPFAGDQPSPDLAAAQDQAAPQIHRSAILPSWAESAYQPLPLLRTHIPDAPNAIETGWPGRSETLQPVLQPAFGAPIAQPSSAVTMRAADQQSDPVASGAIPGEPSTVGLSNVSSNSALPLVRRSAIIPALPQASLQREPAVSTIAGGSVSSAEPTPSAAAPASLDWSALPLLQRLSVEHGLPAMPTAPSTTGSGGASVAARLVQRLALDDPQGMAAPMPLMRMQAPPDMPTVNRTVETHDSAADASIAPSSTTVTAGATALLPALVRRSAILPSLPSLTPAEPGSALAAAGPAAEAAIAPLQCSDAVSDWSALPMLQRSGLGNLLGGFERARSMIPTLPSPRSALSGLGLPLDNLEQQARSMIPTLPSPRSALGGLGLPLDNLEQQARSMIPTLPSPRSALSGLGLPLDNLEQRAGSMLTQATSGMPQLPLLQQMNWQSAQQAAGLSNLGLPDFGDDSEMAGAADIPDTASESVESPAGGRPATELPLLKPTRPEQQAAPEQSQSAAADGEAAPGSPGSTSGAATGATDPAGAAGKQGKHDIEQLAQQVYARLRHRLLVDRERLGPF